MLRPVLALLLLLNYLLVVGAGLLVSRPEAATFSAAHPYVHSQQCQQHNYLRLDCFEQCNGNQHSAHKAPTGTGLHYLAQLKGLDVHFLARPLAAAAVAPAHRQPARQAPVARHPALPAGFGGRDYPPPQHA